MEYMRSPCILIGDGLIKLGLLEGPAETVIENETYMRFYMHRTSHWIGLDVHDVGAYSIQCVRSDYNMQGWFLPSNQASIFHPPMKRFQSAIRIGVRIEDDVLR